MRKEKLAEKKRGIVNVLPWYVSATMTEDDLRQFSAPQLHALCEILQRAENYREGCSPFFTLSALEVLQKETGEIAYFDPAGSIRQETEEEVLSGAACQIYRHYMAGRKA